MTEVTWETVNQKERWIMATTAMKLSDTASGSTQNSAYLIELTAKRWKGLMLVAFVLGVLGVSVMIWQIWVGVYRPLIESGFTLGTSPLSGFGHALSSLGGILGILIFVSSLAIGFYAKFMAWWRHG